MSNFLVIYEVPIPVHNCVIRRHFSGESNHTVFSSFNTFLAFRCKFTRKENDQPGSFGTVKIYFLVIHVFSSPHPASKTLHPTPVTLFFLCQKANGQKVVRSRRDMRIVKSVFTFPECVTFHDIHVCPM